MSLPGRRPWRVVFSDAAKREWARLSPERRHRVKDVRVELERGPWSRHTKQLEGDHGWWTYVLDKWWIVFAIDWDGGTIEVKRIRPRATAYEGIERRSRPDA